MRKVLLATTALVALGGVSAASADVSVSGNASITYSSTNSNDASLGQDGNITIKGTSTSDAGVTYSVVYNQSIMRRVESGTANDSTAAGDIEDSYLQAEGDFGTIFAGATDSALDRVDGVLGQNFDYEGHNPSGTTNGKSNLTLIGTEIGFSEDSATINYMSPKMNGIQIQGVFLEGSTSQTGMGVSYSNDLFSVIYQTSSGAKDKTTVGASFSAAGVTVGLGAQTEDDNGTETKSSDVGVKYSMGEMGLYYTNQKGKKTTTEHKYTSLGVTYSIAPGVTAALESTTGDVAGVKSSGTFAAINVAF
jgi:hypothetical protein